MKYQKLTSLLDNTSNQLSKFGKRNWAEIIDESRGTNSNNSQIKFDTFMIRSLYCYIVIRILLYTHAYMLKELQQSQILEQQQPKTVGAKKVILWKFPPFTNFIGEINNTQVDDAHDVDVVMPMYSLI